MNKDERNRYTKLLLDLRTRLATQVNDMVTSIQEGVNTPGEITTVPTHNADRDPGMLDAQIGITQNEEGLLEEVEAALERIEDGTYGKCRNCSSDIPRERLDALPYTPYCLACAKKLETESQDDSAT